MLRNDCQKRKTARKKTLLPYISNGKPIFFYDSISAVVALKCELQAAVVAMFMFIQCMTYIDLQSHKCHFKDKQSAETVLYIISRQF